MKTHFAEYPTWLAHDACPIGGAFVPVWGQSEHRPSRAGTLCANNDVVPFSQAVKSVAFLAAQVSKPVWAAARKLRQVVSRHWAMTLLETMSICRPPLLFELHDCVRAFIVDQTYARTGGCGTPHHNPQIQAAVGSCWPLLAPFGPFWPLSARICTCLHASSAHI